MKTKYLITLLALFVFLGLPAQTNLNNYKYILVPKKFDFLKNADQYQLNSLTKFLFEKENFKTIFDDEDFPEDLAKDRCLALEANVIDESGLFKTKLMVQLKDCKNNILFTSRMGDSKEKEYQKAYYESLRGAFQSFQSVNYVYKPNQITKDIPVIAEPIKQSIVENTPVVESAKAEEIKEVKPVSKKELEKPIIQEPKIKEEIKPDEKNIILQETNPSDILYAQVLPNGFQLVDSSPRVVYTIYYSGKKDIYIVKGKDALIYKLNDAWVIAEQKGNDLGVNSINIKF